MRKKQFMGIFAFALALGGAGLTIQTPVNAASKVGSVSSAKAINGVVYATVNLPYADFYYGEIYQINPDLAYTSGSLSMTKDKVTDEGLRDEDQYDAVTSATTTKSKKFAATYYKDNSDGSVDIEGIKDVQIAIPETLYNDILAAKEKGTTCSNGIYDIVTNMTISEAAFDEYKVLNADGTFSMMKTETEVDTDAVSTITSNSTWGDYQIDFENIEVESDDMLGAVIEAEDSAGNKSYYGMKHESNLWLNTNEMSFAIQPFYVPQDKVHSVDYKLHEALEGQTITKITYMVKNAADVVMNTNLLVKNQLPDNASISMSDVDLRDSDMVTTFQADHFPSGYDFTISAITYNGSPVDESAYEYDAAKKELTLKSGKNLKAGAYSVSFTDDSYIDSSASFNVNSALTSDDITIKDNILTVLGGVSSREDYLDAIDTVSINGNSYSVSGSTLFNNDGSVNFEASTNFHGTTTTYFPGGENADYTIEIKANGYPTITGTIGTSYSSAYRYVYAALNWEEYWAGENVFAGTDTSSSTDEDSKGELDKGAFDAVTRATTNHGLHRGSFQSIAVIYDTEGNTYEVSSWTSATNAILNDGSSITFSKGAITLADGSTKTMDHYTVNGIKYVPVAVKNSDYTAFCEKYEVAENGSLLSGGYTEQNLKSYTVYADVTKDTNGLKTASKNEDGSFTFSKKMTGTDSGIRGQALKNASNITVTVKEADGAYGEFLRVDLTGDGYGDLGSNMSSVRWTYYGSDAARKTALQSYGTKFAADNWMHKTKGIQLGLTDSLRCQLPEGTDGTGYWTITVSALGYNDYSIPIEVTSDNIVTPDASEINTDDLSAAITKAEGLKAADYTTASWADLQTELAEAKEELSAKHSQAAVNEAKEHLLSAIANLKKVTDNGSNNNNSSNNNSGSNTNSGSNANTSVPAPTVKLSKTTVKIGKTAKKTIKITWKKTANASGYQIQYSLKKNFKGVKTITVSSSKNSTVIKKLKRKKKYYIRIRSFAKSGSTITYSSWSNTKTGKTK